MVKKSKKSIKKNKKKFNKKRKGGAITDSPEDFTQSEQDNLQIKTYSQSEQDNLQKLGEYVGDGINYTGQLLNSFLSGIQSRSDKIKKTYSSLSDQYNQQFKESIKIHEQNTNTLNDVSITQFDRKLMQEGQIDTLGIYSIFTVISDKLDSINDKEEKLIFLSFIASFTMKQLSILFDKI